MIAFFLWVWFCTVSLGLAIALSLYVRLRSARSDYQELHDELAAAYREIRLLQWRARRNVLPPAWFPEESGGDTRRLG